MVQKWYEQLCMLCSAKKIETIVGNDNKIHLFCAELPDGKEKESITSLIPNDCQYEFHHSIKETSLLALRHLLTMAEARSFKMRNENRCLTLDIDGQIPDDHPAWAEINKVLTMDGYYKRWTIAVNGSEYYTYDPVVAEDHQKNQDNHERIIKDDDVMNLKIALESTDSVDEFLKQIGVEE